MRSLSAIRLCFWNHLICSCLGYTDFLFPGQSDLGVTINYVDTVYIVWASDISSAFLNIWCAKSPSEPLVSCK